MSEFLTPFLQGLFYGVIGAKLDTSQDASPQQCRAVALAQLVLEHLTTPAQ